MPEVENSMENSEDYVEKPHKKTKSFLNKVVIRKLPPNLSEEAFIDIISPLPDHQELYFCAADWTLGAEATTRAYIEFNSEEDIFIFKEKFDGYIFVDSVRGSDYAAIVEYAPFQGLPKSRARKKDKNVGTIESEQHFLNFLDLMKQEEEADQKNEPKLEYSYQLKDDKKVTSTPLIEFLSAKNQEKRDSKRKKLDDKRKQREDEKKSKKIQVAKNVPEPIKEEKDDVVFEDGIMVRTVPSRLGRNEKKKESKGKEQKQRSEENTEKDQERREKERDRRDRGQDRREKREKDSKAKPKSEENVDKEKEKREKRENKEKTERDAREARRKVQKEKDDKRRMERYEKSLQKPKESADPDKTKSATESKVPPVKTETKRYSALRKARQEKTNEVKDSTDASQKQDEGSIDDEIPKIATQDKPADEEGFSHQPDDSPSASDANAEARKEARLKRIEERRAREADERAQRQIKNKDRPSMQIYQPKRRQESDSKTELRSSDENSEASRKRSDNDRRRERRSDKKPSRKNSRDEAARKKKTSRSEDDAADKPSASEAPKVSEEKEESLEEKLENLALGPEESKAETVAEAPSEVVKESNEV